MLERVENAIATVFVFGCIALACIPLIAAGAILFSQVIGWLRYGAWHPVPVRSLADMINLQIPPVSWIGVQKLIDFVLALPASLFLAVVFVVAIRLAIRLAVAEYEGRSRGMSRF